MMKSTTLQSIYTQDQKNIINSIQNKKEIYISLTNPQSSALYTKIRELSFQENLVGFNKIKSDTKELIIRLTNESAPKSFISKLKDKISFNTQQQENEDFIDRLNKVDWDYIEQQHFIQSIYCYLAIGGNKDLLETLAHFENQNTKQYIAHTLIAAVSVLNVAAISQILCKYPEYLKKNIAAFRLKSSSSNAKNHKNLFTILYFYRQIEPNQEIIDAINKIATMLVENKYPIELIKDVDKFKEDKSLIPNILMTLKQMACLKFVADIIPIPTLIEKINTLKSAKDIQQCIANSVNQASQYIITIILSKDHDMHSALKEITYLKLIEPQKNVLIANDSNQSLIKRPSLEQQHAAQTVIKKREALGNKVGIAGAALFILFNENKISAGILLCALYMKYPEMCIIGGLLAISYYAYKNKPEVNKTESATSSLLVVTKSHQDSLQYSNKSGCGIF